EACVCLLGRVGDAPQLRPRWPFEVSGPRTDSSIGVPPHLRPVTSRRSAPSGLRREPPLPHGFILTPAIRNTSSHSAPERIAVPTRPNISLPDACLLVGVRATAKSLGQQGTTTMKKNYQTKTAAALTVPDSVAIAMTDLADELREGLLALAVGTGLQVMGVLLEESVTALAGPKGRHDPDRTAVRHGHEEGSVTLGGRRVPVRRPRVRSADGACELAVPAYEHFSSTEVLNRLAMEKMLAKLST